MADFLIQTNAKGLELEEQFLIDELKRSKYIHTYQTITADSLTGKIEDNQIPVGDIRFVEKALGLHENPIEIPIYLRTEEFLKRDYRIVPWTEIPEQGEFFLKDVSGLKNFASILNVNHWDVKKAFEYTPKNKYDTTLSLNKDHLFQVSSLFNYKAEYRVYVINGKIENIGLYNGSPLYQPDMHLLQIAVNLITLNEKWLKSYTIDVMVGDKGTALVEIHNFASVGLYSTQWGSELPYAYIDGINYLKNDNKPIQIN